MTGPAPHATRAAPGTRIRARALAAAAAAAAAAACLAACGVGRADAGGSLDGDAAAADTAPVRLAVDMTRRTAISRYIYGVNMFGAPQDPLLPAWPNGVTLSRFGGNRLTAYNWENNASNAGRDYDYHNDLYLGGGMRAGEAARLRVRGALARGAGVIVTVPTFGYVARDADQTNVGTDPATLQARLAARFVRSLPAKPGPFAAAPDLDDDAVYQDEFVHWLARTFPRPPRADSTPIFYALDNEPDIWGSTHEELLPKEGGRMATLTYDALVDRSIAFARAIKRADPGAVVLGPGTATWTGLTTLGRYPTPDPRHGRRVFLDVYLERMREAERAEGRRLLDVLDVHWYPEALVDGQRVIDDMTPQTPAVTNARLQLPRSLWDSTYDEKSWVTEAKGGPVRLIPYLRAAVAAHYPGTKISITEYYYGRGGDIDGGVTQADVLGVYGREGVFAATLWPLANLAAVPYGGSAERGYQYAAAAFRMYRDYDGRGAAFGDVGLAARTSDPVGSSVYASTDSSGAKVTLVLINKRRRPRAVDLEVTGARGGWRTAEVYTLTDAAPAPQRRADLPLGGATRVRYTMPALSVTTLALRP